VRAAPQRGFTLVEAVIVLAVTAILLALALPSWGSFTTRARLLSASEALVHDLGLARQEAAQRGVPLYLLPQAGTAWCWAISAQAGCDCRQPAASCALRVVDATEHRGVELLAAHTMRFDPADGRSDGGLAAAWRASSAYAAQVHVHPFGRARLCSSGAALRGVPAC